MRKKVRVRGIARVANDRFLLFGRFASYTLAAATRLFQIAMLIEFSEFFPPQTKPTPFDMDMLLNVVKKQKPVKKQKSSK